MRKSIAVVAHSITIEISPLRSILRKSIAIIPKPIVIAVGPFTGVERELIGPIRNTVSIIIIIKQVALPVTVGVRRNIGTVQRVALATQLVYIRPSITVVVGIRVVAHSVPIGIGVLVRIEGKSILHVIPPITVVIGVGVVTDPITIRVDSLVGIEWKSIPIVRYTVVVVIGI